MRTAAILVTILLLFAYVSNEDYKDQLAMANERSCLAKKFGQTTNSVRRADGSVQCTTYENVGMGLVPRLKFAEVWAR